MMSLYTQQSRRLAVHTPLGEDALLLEHATGVERLSGLFNFDLQMTSRRDDLDYRKIIGEPVTIALREENWERVRFFNGRIARFAYVGHDDRLSHYRAEVVPWLWFLTRNTDCRIFQHKSVPDIIEEVFRGHGFSDFENALTGSHPKRDFCVQYRETDFSFVSRLMEEEGIFYYFRHEHDRHVLVMADSKAAYEDCPDIDREVELASNMSGMEQTDRIRRWEHAYCFRTGRAAQRDFNFKTPSDSLFTATHTKMEIPAAPQFELYDYPGRYEERSGGAELTRLRMEEEEAQHNIARGESVCRGFAPGRRFTLVRHDAVLEQEKSYVITEVRHTMHGGGYETSRVADQIHEHDEYVNEFLCIPDDVTYRPQRVTPKPVVHGTQTAIVVGPKGQEIYTDEFGRVKVQFHWDRYGRYDADSSCWVRVSQPWAGKGWGGVQIPRIGQEVIIDYLEGDPDRPIITGRVYNAESMPPVSEAGRDTGKGEVNPKNMMEAAMQMTMRSQSLGGSGGHNEITMHDAGGAEKLFIRAQKDEVHNVLNDRKDMVGNDETREVANDRMRKVGNNELVAIGVNETRQVGQNQQVSVGQNILINAGTSITLKCGASTIHMNQAGFITMSGTVINIAGAINCNMVAPITSVTGGIVSMNTGGVANVIASGGPTAMLAGGNHTITSAAKASVGAPQVDINGANQVAIDGGGETSIVGGKVKIN